MNDENRTSDGSETPSDQPVDSGTPAPDNASPEPPAPDATAPDAPAPAPADAPTATYPAPQPYGYTAPTAPTWGSQPAHPAQPAAHTQPQQPQHPAIPQPGFAQQHPHDGSAFGPAAAPTYATAPGTAATAPTATRKRSLAVPVIVALAVGAVLGGVSGAGVTALTTHNSGSAVSSSDAKPQTVTVNDTSKVNQITAVAAKVSPSVVTISVSASSEAGTGSGVILSDDGYVLTNTHVVTLDGATSGGTIEVTTSDGSLYQASIVGTDPTDDLAVIKLKNAKDLQPIDFGDSDKLNVGATVIAIGAPLGLSNTVTDGIVSAVNRSISIASSAAPDNSDSSSGSNGQGGSSPFDFWDNGSSGSSSATSSISVPVIQTDASINPGNSGGALLDDSGKLVGINVAIASAGGSSSSGTQSGSIGVGFAIPANVAKRISDEIIASGKATHGLLGASVSDASSSNSSTVGAIIAETPVSGGAADKAGLEKGDVVTKLDGKPITGATDLTAQVRALKGGADATLTYTRDGSSHQVTVTLGTYKS